MLTKANKYRGLIEKANKRLILFPKTVSGSKQPFVIWQSNQILPSSYPFKSSQQIDNNIPIIHHTIQKTSKENRKNQWPQSCIGLVLCQYHESNHIFYVYGTGTLIHDNKVLTSAQNIYSRRLHKQYKNIRFITGVNGNKCSGIYDVKQVHYPKEYTMQQDYKNYNFSVLQLHDDLSENCGYLGWKTTANTIDQQLITYRYIFDKMEESFEMQIKHKQLAQYSEVSLGNEILVKGNQNEYYIVGLNIKSQTKQHCVLSQKMRDIINQWSQENIIDLNGSNIGHQGCKYMSVINQKHLTQIYLSFNNINAQGCKHLSQTSLEHLNAIYLDHNNIGTQGCKYLSQANWIYLTIINLQQNNIGDQGCKYLSQTNWTRLNIIDLTRNKIADQGYIYLNQANWINLTKIYLGYNRIYAQVMVSQYMSHTSWIHLTAINLNYNKIGSSGCKYLSQNNWIHLTKIQLINNNIDSQGCNYLRQTNWIYLNEINLNYNNINSQGWKYLSQSNWINLKKLYSQYINYLDKMILKQSWKNVKIKQ